MNCIDEIFRIVETVTGEVPDRSKLPKVIPTDPVEQCRLACEIAAGKKGLEATKEWTSYYQGGAYFAQYDCYLTAYRDVLGLDLPIYEKYKYWEECAIEGTFRVMHRDFCIVTDFPEVLKYDDQNRAHCENGPSHRWRDGFEVYHWHGVHIPAEWITNKESLTAEMALKWTNIEQRRAACEILGWDKILDELGATIIDEDPDPEVGTLLEIDLPDSGKEKFLRVLCGTGRTFALPVPPEIETALEGQAWSFGIDPKDFVLPEVRT